MHWSVYQKSARRRRIWPILFGMVGLTLVSLVGFNVLILKNSPETKQASNKVTKDLAKPSDISSVEGRYLLNGTVTWARAVEKQANGDYSQPFSMLDTFHRDLYDAWSTDFECPITNNVVPYQTQISDLVFNCRPEFLPEATKYFNIFDLANNHTDNQGGEKGLDETRQHLKDAGAQYFGTFDPADSKNVCEVLALPVRVKKTDQNVQKAEIPVAFCGWHYFYRKPLPGEIDVMKRYAKIMPVFAFVEMGVEYHPKADAIQNEIAHEVIDVGPEFLMANNPHWVQNTEVYKDKLIVYSPGNFIFDQTDAETMRGASLDVDMTVSYDDNIAKWLALAPSCASFHDDCLERAEQQGLKKPKLQLKFGVVADQNGYKQVTHKADDATQKAVEVRMNWAETCKQLGYNRCQ
ncbi:MAG: CapA family protein [Candidatus Saccharimonadales bacterium]